MGKTTFMINLYVKNYSFFNLRRNYKMRLYPFGDSRIIDLIKQIKPEEAKNTILLLDAFDEDKKLIPPDQPDGLSDEERFRKRLDEIIEAVRDFREVIITSRTQYFPGQESQPYELKIPRFDDSGFHKLAKLYLSPFDSKEIKRYLNKKYGLLRFWNRTKKQHAFRIVNSSPKLMVRPMLLSYIDFLVESNRTFTNTYQIYETLIEKWIDREATKRKQMEDRDVFKRDLYNYSRLLANEIFLQRKESEMLFLDKEAALEVASKNNIHLKGYQITGQSLLTRDASGNWKFAHKSILEFFIAQQLISNAAYTTAKDYPGFDMVKQFYKDVIPDDFVCIKGGTFVMGSPEAEPGRENNEKQHKVTVSTFFLGKFLITQGEYEKLIHKNPSKHKGNSMLPVEMVSWYDAISYCNLLNKKNGFQPTYNNEGQLLDSNGQITRDVTKVVGYRLPTEAEWEYACRAGTTTAFNTGETITKEQANFIYESGDQGNSKGTTKVGTYPPNAWGLYDMHGNVWEWCYDMYGDYIIEEQQNPLGPNSGNTRVVRGGSCFGNDWDVRCASRLVGSPVDRFGFIGFRLVLSPF